MDSIVYQLIAIMGIKSLFNWIRKNYPEVIEDTHLSQYSYMKVAIDISLYMHTFKAAAGDQWITSFVNLIACLRKNNLHCIFIFDGKSPPEKLETQMKRREEREKRNDEVTGWEEDYEIYKDTCKISDRLIALYEKVSNIPQKMERLLGTKKPKINMVIVDEYIKKKRKQLYSITPADFDRARELFDILKVPYCTAPEEADPMCADLCRSGLVDAVLSDDSDMMALGAPIFLTKLEIRSGDCKLVVHKTLLEAVEFSYEEFIDFCIMCGCDYNTNIPGVGPAKAYTHLVKHRTIDNIAKYTELDTDVLNYVTCRRKLIDFPKKRVDVLYCGVPDFKVLERFSYKHNLNLNIHRLQVAFTINTDIIFSDVDE